MNFGMNPISEKAWRELDEVLLSASLKVPPSNSSGASIQAIPFVTDMPSPERLSSEHAQRILSVISNEELMRFYNAITGLERLCIRRCQGHILVPKTNIEPHVDTVTNKYYKHPVILQFSDDYTGGEYVVFHPLHGKQVFSLPRFSMLISTGSIMHEVRTVTSGVRRSLVYFLAETDEAIE